MLGKIIWKNIVPIMFGVGALVYGYTIYTASVPCVQPLEYRIGTLDPRFGVTKEQLLADLGRASAIWEKAYGTTLFAYSEDADVTVSLVYDNRQQATQQEQVLTSKINETKLSAGAALDEYKELQVAYVRQSTIYSNHVSEFKTAQDTFNARVAAYNKQSEPSPDEYEALQAAKKILEKKVEALESERQSVNRLAADANALAKKYNLLVEHINENVQEINNSELVGTEFEEGVYISDEKGQRIEIYQFDDKTTFVRVLAHELGHALGLGHNDGVDSIMNAVNKSSNLVATAEDTVALEALCKGK